MFKGGTEGVERGGVQRGMKGGGGGGTEGVERGGAEGDEGGGYRGGSRGVGSIEGIQGVG